MRAAILLLAGLLAIPANAAETAWQEIAPGVRLRLITADQLKPDGTSMAGLELDMPQGVKTYWRVPGESGIPTEIELQGSTGIASHRIVWPYPVIEEVGGLTDFVYRGPTVLPIELGLAAERGDLQLSVVMGICSDICIPAMATFGLPLDFSRPDRGQGLRIAQAVARAPRPWSEPAAPLGPVAWDAAANALAVPLADPRIDPLSIIADASAAGQLFGAPQKSPDGSAVFLPLLGQTEAALPAGTPVDLTFMTQMGPFSLSTTIGGGSTAGT